MESFRLKNVKAFVDSGTIQLRPITLIIGQNSSGKSSLLRFPLVLKQTFRDDSKAPLLFYGNSIDYGNVEDVVFGHDTNQTMEFELTISTSDLLPYLPSPTSFNSIEQIKEKLGITNYLTVKFAISLLEKRICLESMHINVADEELISVYVDENLDEQAAFQHEITNGTISIEYHPEMYNTMFEKFLIDSDVFSFLKFKASNGDYDESEYPIFNFYETLVRAIISYFNYSSVGINYIGPTRLSAERSYRFKENAVNYVGREGEFAPVILAQDFRSGGELLSKVSQWLSDHLNFALEVDSSDDTFKLMISDVSDVEKTNDTSLIRNNLIDVGHGLSQLLPIIVQVFMDSESNRHTRRKIINSSLINLIEQPELHLHPAAQAAMADLFIAGIPSRDEEGHTKRTFLIETHSEHMLLRLRRRIVEGTLDPNDVAIYYTEKNKDGKSASIRKLEIESDGSIPDWPEGLFEEDYREVLELREAMRKKQKGGESLPW